MSNKHKRNKNYGKKGIPFHELNHDREKPTGEKIIKIWDK